MHEFSDAASLRAAIDANRRAGKSIALVPTMGNLHAGHLALVDAAKSAADFVITSIFVNPLQFGPTEDLDAYPRTLTEDKRLLEEHACDAVFMPSVQEMYGDDLEAQTIVHVPEISEGYCGRSRPGHFDGVATVVSKLFNLVAPDSAWFGLKDYQQFLVIRKMVSDLRIPVRIEGVEIVRDSNGLALSSRNNYLDDEEKAKAAAIYRLLTDTRQAIAAGSRDYRQLESAALADLESTGLRPDYFAICNAGNLVAATATDSNLVILAAAYVGPSRLIDNVRFRLDG